MREKLFSVFAVLMQAIRLGIVGHVNLSGEESKNEQTIQWHVPPNKSFKADAVNGAA